MFRVVCFVSCAFSFLVSTSAGAQSTLSMAGDSDDLAPAPSAPLSITQRYVANAAPSARELSLLIDETQPMTQIAPSAPQPRIVMTSPVPASSARMAVNDLGIGRRTIVVSNVRGLSDE